MIKTVLQSENAKLVGRVNETRNWSPRPVAATMRAAGPSCPETCAFLKDRSCYAMYGPIHWQSKRLTPDVNDAAAVGAFIRGLPPSWLLRHHASGDVFADGVVDRPYLDAILAAHRARPDVTAWTYTHDWKALREAGYTQEQLKAGGLAVNASCDTLDDAHEAAWEGWPVVITAHSTETRRRWQEGELDVVRCPAETAQVACNTCLLCAKADRSFAIAFSHHGSGKKKADARLVALQELPMAGD